MDEAVRKIEQAESIRSEPVCRARQAGQGGSDYTLISPGVVVAVTPVMMPPRLTCTPEEGAGRDCKGRGTMTKEDKEWRMDSIR